MMGEIRSDIGVAAEQVLSQGRIDAFLQGVSEPGSLVRELRRLRAENAALKAILERAVASSHNCWEAEARALLSPQAAELPCPTIEQVEGAYGEAMYEQERETR
jgi:hypothetical protein